MWTRKELKTAAKQHFKANYWMSVLVALVITVFFAAGSSAVKENAPDLNTIAAETGISSDTLLAILLGILGVSVIISILVKIFLANPVKVGTRRFFLGNAYGERPGFGDIFFAFKTNYVNIGCAMFMRDLLLGLWTMLFVIPGIVKAYSYSMTEYILAENPNMSWSEAITLSRQMMNGQKWKRFVLDLSFIGWHILSVLTLGILNVFYVAPYVHQTDAELYLALKNQ